MVRTRAGHGLTWIKTPSGRSIPVIRCAWRGWITTGQASGWPRCPRCRVPTNDKPFGSPLCMICYWYRTELDVGLFWKIHEAGYPLAPYNCGRRGSFTHPNDGLRKDWRTQLRERQELYAAETMRLMRRWEKSAAYRESIGTLCAHGKAQWKTHRERRTAARAVLALLEEINSMKQQQTEKEN